MSTSHFRRRLLALVAAVALAACEQVDVKPPEAEPAAVPVQQRLQALLDKAAMAPSPQREHYELQAAALMLAEGRLDAAEQLLTVLESRRLSGVNLSRFGELWAALHLARGDAEAALRVLEAPALLAALPQLPLERQLAVSELRANIFARLGSHLASAQERIYIAPLLSDAERLAQNREAIWHSLMYVDRATLREQQTRAVTGDYLGWLELAIIAKDNQGDLDRQVQQLETWQQRWPAHPAATQLPGGLELLRDLAASRPQRVALLLPLSGKLGGFGRAIRDGFLAAWYRTRNQGGEVPLLRFYDTEAASDFLGLYRQAVADGAELIIGPLEKQRVEQLFPELLLPVPTLALNRVDGGMPPLQLYQFGLAPEDEARQVAEVARLNQHRRALVLAPEGAWSERVSDAFIQRWLTLDGDVTALGRYAERDSYAAVIENVLNIEQSEARARRVRELIGRHIEFTPRRRADVDMIFLLAKPAEARSIKPLLDYLYAGDLPVYSTSNIYAGQPAPEKDADINGVFFLDMPWVLNPPGELAQAIYGEFDQARAFGRMYALGIDAFQLHPRLRQLDELPNSRVYGQTGTLGLNERNEIERELLLARIRGGKPVKVPVADRSLPAQTLTTEGTVDAQREKDDAIPGGWPERGFGG